MQPGCDGEIRDGFCDVCGLAPAEAAQPTATGPSTSAGFSNRTGSARGSRRGTSRSSSRSSRTGRTSRGRLGAGLVTMPEVPYRDPSEAVLANPEVPEHERYCCTAASPSAAARRQHPAAPRASARSAAPRYDFEPKLAPGDLVAGQYEVLGCIAHGGLGWIYLATRPQRLRPLGRAQGPARHRRRGRDGRRGGRAAVPRRGRAPEHRQDLQLRAAPGPTGEPALHRDGVRRRQVAEADRARLQGRERRASSAAARAGPRLHDSRSCPPSATCTDSACSTATSSPTT